MDCRVKPGNDRGGTTSTAIGSGKLCSARRMIAKKAPPAAANGAQSREETPKRGGGRRPTAITDRSVTSPTIEGVCRAEREAAHTAQQRTDARRSDLDLLVLHHPFDGGTLEHALLERGVVLELRHRQLAAESPGVEDEAIGIEHGVLVAEPFPSRQLAVDLLQVAVEGLEARFLERGKGGRVGRVALGPADMGVRG